MQRVILVGAALVLLHTPAIAQTCEGRPSFSAGGAVVGAGAAFADGVNRFAGGIGMGARNGVYGGAVIGTTSYDALDGSSFDVGGVLGYQVPMGRTGMVHLCPTGAAMMSR